MQACSDLAHVVLVLVGVRHVRVSQLSLSTLVMKVYLSLYTFAFVRELLYQEIFSLNPPSVTVDCVDCYRYNHDNCASNSC